MQYASVKLASDLPFPPGATAIEYDPDHGRLACVTTQPVEKLLVFFDAELVRLDWSVAPSQVGVSRATATGAAALYVRGRKTALKLTLDNRDDGTTAVKLKEVPEETIVDEKAKSNEKANVDENPNALRHAIEFPRQCLCYHQRGDGFVSTCNPGIACLRRATPASVTFVFP